MTPADDRAERFAAALPGIIQGYRRELEAVNSPLAADPAAWAQCELQARRILRDCVASLRSGEPVVDRDHITDVVDLGVERMRQGIHATHSVRAGMLLNEQTLLVLEEQAREDPGMDEARLIEVVRTLQRGIGLRIEAGVVGQDTYLLAKVRELNDQGRRRLARDIHDKIGNELSLAMRQMEFFEVAARQAGPERDTHLDRIRQTLDQALKHTRDLITELRRPVLAGTLETALRAFTHSLGEAAPPVQIWVRGSEDWLPPAMHEELFLMVRECLRNSYAHAGSTNVVVYIDIDPQQVQAEVIDDGRGFDLDEVRRTRSTNGLCGAVERAELFGGTLNIDSVVGSGTHVSIWLPVPGRGAGAEAAW